MQVSRILLLAVAATIALWIIDHATPIAPTLLSALLVVVGLAVMAGVIGGERR